MKGGFFFFFFFLPSIKFDSADSDFDQLGFLVFEIAMACLYRNAINFIGGLNETARTQGVIGLCKPSVLSQPREFKSTGLQVSRVDFMGKSLDQIDSGDWTSKSPNKFYIHAQTKMIVSRAMKWWDKNLKPNMVDIHSAQELVDSLKNAGDRLVIIDFYSPGCGGCRALHPKTCQLAESYPDAIFLKVNYEELNTMCHSLNIHVLPFFRFYRGAEGRLCSFSCTNATIKKFKDALRKHGADRCSLGPAKGLDESELIKLASVGELVSTNLQIQSTKKEIMKDLFIQSIDLSHVLTRAGENKMELKEDNVLQNKLIGF